MKTCECGKQLASNADKCPQCGKVFTNRAAWMLLGLVVVVGLAFLIGIIKAKAEGRL